MTAQTELTPIEVVFLGRRRFRGEGSAFKVVEVFAMPTEDCTIDSIPGRATFTAGKVRLIPGAVYATKGRLDENGRIESMITKVAFARASGFEMLTREAKALDDQVQAQLDAERAEKRVKADDPIAREVERLAQMIAKSRGYDAQTALRAAVTRAIEERVYQINRGRK